MSNLLQLVAGGGRLRAAGPPTPVATTVTISGPTSVAEGGTAQLSATVYDQFGTVMSGQAVTWASDSANATVDSSGSVSGVTAGSANITATCGAATSAPYAVTVTAAPVATTVTVSGSSSSVAVGSTLQLTATVRDQYGAVMSGQPVTWSSSDTLAATVDSTGKVTGKGQGTATIIAASGSASGSDTITVTAAAASSATISPTDSTIVRTSALGIDQIPIGGYLRLYVNRYVGGVKQSPGSFSITWTVSDTSGLINQEMSDTKPPKWVASPGTDFQRGQAGQIQFLPNWLGTITVTATLSTGEVVSTTVTAALPADVPIDSFVLGPSEGLAIAAGETWPIFAVPQDVGLNAIPGRTITWGEPADTAIATAGAPGVTSFEGMPYRMVAGGNVGSTTISATCEGRTASMTLQVLAAGVVSATVDFENGQYSNGSRLSAASPAGTGPLPFRWGISAQQSATTSRAHDGTLSMGVYYDGGSVNIVAQSSEQYFDFQRGLPEFWMRYWVFYPSNFTPLSGSRWKSLLMYNSHDFFPEQWVAWAMDGYLVSDLKTISCNFEFGSGPHNYPYPRATQPGHWIYPDSGNPWFDDSTNPGAWYEHVVHVRHSSSPETADGLVETWINGVKNLNPASPQLRAPWLAHPYLATGYFNGAGGGTAKFPTRVDFNLDSIEVVVGPTNPWGL